MYGGVILKQLVLDIWYQGGTVENIVNELGKDKTTPKDVAEVLLVHYDNTTEEGQLRCKILKNAVLFLAKHRGATLDELNTLKDLLKKYIF